MPATQTITNSCTYNQYVQRFVMNFVFEVPPDYTFLLILDHFSPQISANLGPKFEFA